MIDITDKIYRRVKAIIDTWNEPDIYAISFFVYSNEAYEYKGFRNVSSYYASCHRESDDALPMSVFSAVIAACTVGYYIIRTVGFSRMIRVQSRKYGVDFDDAGAVTVSGMFPRVICGRVWMIQPCRLALYRGHIQKASVTERIGKGGVRYAVRIKTVSGKIYNITFTNEKRALRVRDFVRGKHIA